MCTEADGSRTRQESTVNTTTIDKGINLSKLGLLLLTVMSYFNTCVYTVYCAPCRPVQHK